METPKHQVSLRGLFNPVTNWEADIWFRFVDDLMASKHGLETWNLYTAVFLPTQHLPHGPAMWRCDGISKGKAAFLENQNL